MKKTGWLAGQQKEARRARIRGKHRMEGEKREIGRRKQADRPQVRCMGREGHGGGRGMGVSSAGSLHAHPGRGTNFESHHAMPQHPESRNQPNSQPGSTGEHRCFCAVDEASGGRDDKHLTTPPNPAAVMCVERGSSKRYMCRAYATRQQAFREAGMGSTGCYGDMQGGEDRNTLHREEGGGQKKRGEGCASCTKKQGQRHKQGPLDTRDTQGGKVRDRAGGARRTSRAKHAAPRGSREQGDNKREVVVVALIRKQGGGWRERQRV